MKEYEKRQRRCLDPFRKFGLSRLNHVIRIFCFDNGAFFLWTLETPGNYSIAPEKTGGRGLLCRNCRRYGKTYRTGWNKRKARAQWSRHDLQDDLTLVVCCTRVEHTWNTGTVTRVIRISDNLRTMKDQVMTTGRVGQFMQCGPRKYILRNI